MRIALPLAAALALGLAASAAAIDSSDCLACHGDQGLRSEGGHSLFVDEARFKAAVHGSFGCTDCHPGIKELPHPERLPPVDCASCHDEEARDYARSIHAAARKNGAADAATCTSCHGPAHDILPSSDPASRIAKHNLAETCGSCHANPEFLARHTIPFAHPVEAYKLSVHGRAVAAGNDAAPSCSDCHGSHDIVPARDPRSRINHWNVPATCGRCHQQIQRTYQDSVHGRAVKVGVADAPVCTDCHGEHRILAPSEPGSLVNPARVSTVTCGRCHGDERLEDRYNLPRDKVPAFEDSYHGLALRAGSQTVANCASCHGVHNILPGGDPRSTVNPGNLARTCGACHQGAGQRFAIGPVHVRPASASEHPVVRWIRLFYVVVIPLTIGFMLLHNLIDFLAKLARPAARPGWGEQVPRMNLHFRIAHGLVVLSFPVLVWTGFALKFPDAFWAAPLLRWEGQVAFRGIVHRIAGVVLIASLAHHALHLALVRRDRAILRQVLPRLQDLRDLLGVLRFGLGLSPERPRFGKFSYAEKAEYLAFVWGTLVMAGSGLILWFNDFSLRNFPKWVSDAATAMHWYEAILAALSILVWHFYMVVFDPDVYPMDRSWLTGRASAEHLRHTRPAYYRALVAEERRGREEGGGPGAAPAGKGESAADTEPAKKPQASGEGGPEKEGGGSEEEG